MEPFGVWWYGTLSVAYFITLFFIPRPNDDREWEPRERG